MRSNVPEAMVTAMSGDHFKFFIIVAIYLKSGTLWFSSFSKPFVLEGLYINGGADLKAVDTPRMSSSIDREKYRVVLNNVIPLIEHKTGLAGREIEVYIGHYDEFDSPVLGSFDDLLLAYRGGIDEDAIQNDFESISVMLTGTSPMVNLDQRGGYPVSKDGMDQINTNDTSFDFLYKGSSKTLEWGKS